MFGVENLWLFVVSGLLLNLIPGPDSLLIMARSASQGFKAGMAAALGIGTGTCVHIGAAALGMSAVLATSAEAFFVVKLVGAAYLCYLGWQLLTSKPTPASATEPTADTQAFIKTPYRRIFWQGVLTNVLNPKVALFFLAFVPQFIAVDASNKALSFILLGLVFNVNGMLWCSFLAWTVAQAGHKIKLSTTCKQLLNKVTGAVFVTLGVKLALSKAS